MSNNVAASRVALAAILALAFNSNAHGQASAVAATPDDICGKVRQIFFGLNDIGKKGNTKIVPFSKPYHAELIAYFDRGCPKGENFPLPKPGTDMSLANTASDVLTGGGGLKFKLGEPLAR